MGLFDRIKKWVAETKRKELLEEQKRIKKLYGWGFVEGCQEFEGVVERIQRQNYNSGVLIMTGIMEHENKKIEYHGVRFMIFGSCASCFCPGYLAMDYDKLATQNLVGLHVRLRKFQMSELWKIVQVDNNCTKSFEQ